MQKPPKTTFQAKVTRRHTITLPAKLRRELGIQDGDTVELELDGDRAVLRAPKNKNTGAEAVTRLRGILRPYFKDHAEIMAFLAEERSGWAEREARLEERWERAARAREQSNT